MVLVRRWCWIVFLLMLGGEQLPAASNREVRAYSAAASAFQDGMWSRAEVEFAEFVDQYPKSERVPEAILMQAEADIKQEKYLQAVDLLTAREPQAGKLADQYVFWLGEAQFQNEDYTAAAATFARLVRNFVDSTRRLDAAVSEAAARAKLGQWSQVAALLQAPDGVFQVNAAKMPGDDRVVRGRLLLAEALFRQNKLSNATNVLHAVAAQKLAPDLNWQLVQLLCHIQLASGETDAALASTTNLIRLAALTGQPQMRAESVIEQGSILEKLGRLDDAQDIYQQNLSTNVPAAWQRQAILKIAELAAAQTNYSEAAQTLDKFLLQFPNSASADMARLTLGELLLKEYLAQPEVATNGLQNAETQLSTFLNAYKDSPLAGQAYLNRGWCYWLAALRAGDSGDTTGAAQDTAASLADFQAAAERLPPSDDLAVARFKIGDALFAQNDFVGARNNYQAVANDFTDFPAVSAALVPQALYQTVRACMKLGDMAGTTNALARILTMYPTNNLVDNSLLLAGEQLSDLQQPAAARALFQKVEELYPQSTLRPQVELALARTYEQEGSWPQAIAIYDRWVKQYATDKSLPQVEYALAWANFQAGHGAKAFLLFTNFIAQFPTNALAPVAQWWLGDYYFNTGTNYTDAERNYQLVFQKWPDNALAYPAVMQAGRAAMARQGYLDAINYFTKLTSDTNCPTNYVVQALFAYGGALMQLSDTNDPVANFKKAILVFKAIGQTYPDTEQAALAWGEMGDCYLQLAGQPQEAQYYDEATNAYAQVINSPRAGVAARSMAQTGIGQVLEKRAAQVTGSDQTVLLQQALQNYLDVLYGKNLHDDEPADPFWVKKAGLQAATVAEELGEWPQAVNVYRRLEELLPLLHDMLEKKIANAQERVTTGQN